MKQRYLLATLCHRNVSCGGHIRRGQSLVVWAIAEGRKAAEGITRYVADQHSRHVAA
jgi:NADPH-dependent glutamate synthase beta subunit-like oxidoreductase